MNSSPDPLFDPQLYSSPDQHVVAGLAQMLLLGAGHEGLDRAALLAAAGLDEMDVVDRDTLMPACQHQNLAEAIISRRPGVNLGLRFARMAVPGALGALGYVVANSPTLGAALHDFVRYQRLVANNALCCLTRDRLDLRFTVRMTKTMEDLVQPVEGTLAFWVTLGRQLTGVAWRPRRVYFRHQPGGNPEEHAAIFASPVVFGAEENALVLDEATLALPLVQARPERRSVLVQHVQSLLSERDRVGSISGRVIAQLTQTLPAGMPRQVDIAAHLGLSMRTLSRRLKQEGTTFGALLDQVRRELAVRYLHDPSVTISNAALLLGYTEPSTFYRAFKRWTGCTPGKFRQRPT